MGIAERWKSHPPLPEPLEERLPDIVARLRRAGAELIYLFGSAVVADQENVRGPQRGSPPRSRSGWRASAVDDTSGVRV